MKRARWADGSIAAASTAVPAISVGLCGSFVWAEIIHIAAITSARILFSPSVLVLFHLKIGPNREEQNANEYNPEDQHRGTPSIRLQRADHTELRWIAPEPWLRGAEIAPRIRLCPRSKLLDWTLIMIASLTVFSGPMFAGKTTALISAVNARAAESPVVIIKPAMDNRYAETAIVTHDGVSHMAVPVASAADVFAAVAAAAGDAPAQVFADEVQFMEPPHFHGDFHVVVHTLLMAGHRVTCGGLDCDWRGLPFDVTARLLAMADDVTKLTARCAVTGLPAQKTYKKIADGARVVLGAGDTYEPRSNAAWEGADRRFSASAAVAAGS
jgi:thymidine kinase